MCTKYKSIVFANRFDSAFQQTVDRSSMQTVTVRHVLKTHHRARRYAKARVALEPPDLRNTGSEPVRGYSRAVQRPSEIGAPSRSDVQKRTRTRV